MSNITDEPEYDPFPKTGKVKEHEPFIRGWVTDFCKQYPEVSKPEALIEAVRIAVEFEPKFKPETGNDFSTPLRSHLKGLKRILIDREQKHREVPIYETPAERKRRDAEEKGEPTRKIDFSGGGNGTHLSFDFQWTVSASPEVTITYRRDDYNPSGPPTRHRTVAGTQLNGSENAQGAHIARISDDLKGLVDNQQPGAKLSGRMRAVIDHGRRRQREAEQEAENQQSGNYDPVFFWVGSPSQIDVQFYKGRTPPNFWPVSTHVLPMSVRQAAMDADDKRLSLDETIADRGANDHKQQDEVLTALRAAAKEEYPLFSDRERAVLDWLLAGQPGTLTELAAKIDITKGAASKIRDRVVEKLNQRLRNLK